MPELLVLGQAAPEPVGARRKREAGVPALPAAGLSWDVSSGSAEPARPQVEVVVVLAAVAQLEDQLAGRRRERRERMKLELEAPATPAGRAGRRRAGSDRRSTSA